MPIRVETTPIALERQVRFDDRHPVAVQLETALPGQVLLIGIRAGQQLRDHRVATPITIQVIRGEGMLIIGDAPYPAQPGAFFSLVADMPHSATAKTDLVLLVHRAAIAEAESLAPDAAGVGITI